MLLCGQNLQQQILKRRKVAPCYCHETGPHHRASSFGGQCCWFLDAFEQSKKATISLIVFVRPLVRMHQSGHHWTYFREIWHWGPLRRCPETPYLVKIVQNVGYLGSFWRPGQVITMDTPPPYRNYVLKQNHIHWICRYLSQYFKNFWAHKIIFLHLKYLFCRSLCCPLECATRGGGTITPRPQLRPWFYIKT